MDVTITFGLLVLLGGGGDCVWREREMMMRVCLYKSELRKREQKNHHAHSREEEALLAAREHPRGALVADEPLKRVDIERAEEQRARRVVRRRGS